jgi:LysR family transcriptional regulator, low CO2-responsive transcriptional regulator
MDNQYDLYIIGQPPENLDIEFHPFMDNPLVVQASINHPLASSKRIALARLAEEPFLMRAPGSGTRMAAERRFAKYRMRINIRMELGSNKAIEQAIGGGLGSLASHARARRRLW